MPSFTASLDTRQQDRLVKRFRSGEVDRVLGDAAKAGAKDAARVMKDHAPIGISERPSQYYRAHGLGHGTFRATVKAAKIRGRRASFGGLQGRTIGYVIGPMGKNAFTRAWRERDTHWTERIAGSALGAAERASVRELVRYARA